VKRLTVSFALVLAACAALTAPASAQVQPAGTGEPAFTNTLTNRQFFEWPASPGADAYRVKFSYYKDNALVTDVTQTYGATSGTAWADWAGVATLVEGSTYAICAQGYVSYPNDSLFFPDGPNSCTMGTQLGRRAATTIDRTAPAISVSLAGGAATTRQASIGLQVGFEDANAGPFPSNFVCAAAGTEPCTAFSHSAACSVAATGGKNTSFGCQLEPGLPDGPITVCVRAADGAVPDNPNGPNQSGVASSANLSAAQCDSVVLDRAAPSLTLAGPATATVGELVEFTGQAADAGSGLGGVPQWTWGDNTAGGSGNSASHTFTQAGTYKVVASVSDAAGNEAVAEKVVTVAAAPTPPDETPDPGTSDPQPGDPGPQPGDPGPQPGPQPNDPGAKPPVVDSPRPNGPTREQIAKAAGGGGVASARIDSLTLLVPKRFRLAKRRRSLVLGVATEQPGRLSIQLVRKGRVVAKMQRSIAAGSAARSLRLPRGMRAGRYALRVSFTKQGAAWAATGAAKITFVAPRG
jgi:hypothetical protein